MFEGLDQAQLPGAIEAMLFVTDEPVGVIELADMLEADPKLVEQALVDLREKLEREQRGIQLREVAGGWRLYTHPVYHDLVEKYVLSWDTRKLTQAALETLAVIAYTQPATRDGVRAVRGVSSDSAIASLIDKGLVRELTHREGAGASTFGTTKAFLERFGLHDLNDLPPLEDFAPDEQTRRLISERLGAKMSAKAADDTEDEGAGADLEPAQDAPDTNGDDE